ncbi:MAG: hypothetical protein ABI220_04615 [Candidatus Saccharimonadales bacterium]
MSKYDYFVAGRWRNRDAINTVVKQLRDTGKRVYCFIDNSYNGDGISIDSSLESDTEAAIFATENLSDWQFNPTFRKIFEADMQAGRNADAFILVFPAGLSAHMELGVAYGMGKPCFGIGKIEKTEPLYFMFNEIYPIIDEFINAKVRQPV